MQGQEIICVGSDYEDEIIEQESTLVSSQSDIEIIDPSPLNNKVRQKASQKQKVTIDSWLDLTLEEDSFSEELEEIKVLWIESLDKTERFSLKRSDILLPVFEHFAKCNNVHVDRIRLTMDDYTQVYPHDSTESLNFKVTNYLIASLASEEEKNSCLDITKKPLGKNFVELKCLLKDRKKPIICYLAPNQHLEDLAKLCAKDVGSSINKIKLFFDGDPISFKDTPKSLDLEGGECIEIITN